VDDELTPDKARRAAAYDRFSAAVELPMLILAGLMLPILIVPIVWPVHGAMAASFDSASYLIWALFIVEYLAKLALAPDRRRFVRSNVLDLVVIAVPFLRPLRVLRSLRLLRLVRLGWLGSWAVNAVRGVARVLSHRGFHFVLLAVMVLVFVGAAAEVGFESHAPGASIHSYGDALWWAMVTITTVGYGDKVPVTAAGRGVAVVFMVTGVALFGLLTATLSSYFAESGKDSIGTRIDGLRQQLDDVHALLAAVLAQANVAIPPGTSAAPAGTPAGQAPPDQDRDMTIRR
jgi:voltage-gated potassium channel